MRETWNTYGVMQDFISLPAQLMFGRQIKLRMNVITNTAEKFPRNRMKIQSSRERFAARNYFSRGKWKFSGDEYAKTTALFDKIRRLKHMERSVKSSWKRLLRIYHNFLVTEALNRTQLKILNLWQLSITVQPAHLSRLPKHFLILPLRKLYLY